MRGGKGQRRKPIALLADRRAARTEGKVVLDPRPSSGDPPPMPRFPVGRPLAATRELWERFWRSPIAQIVSESDWPRLERWIVYNDEWRRAMRGLQRERLVLGSMGQPVINPLADYAMKLECQIAAVEEKFGLTPLDRMRLGISFGEARRSLADLNEDLNENGDHGEGYELPVDFERRDP